MGDAHEDRPSSKVARLIEEYDLEGFGAELEARWTGDGYERMSLRELADFFNKNILEIALSDSDNNTLRSDVERVYQRLTSEEVSAGIRTDTRTSLEQSGIDVETLESDFVTYQAIRSYLKKTRGAEYEGISDEEKREKDLKAIQRLLTRTHSVIEERLRKLESTDRITLTNFDVLLDAQVLCHECGAQNTVTELIEHGGCECQQ